MKRPKRTLFERVEYFGLTTEYADDLPDKICGYLDPSKDARFIMINRNHPRSEQNFTIAHELAHYIHHHGKGCFPLIIMLIRMLKAFSSFKWASNSIDRLRQFRSGLMEGEANFIAMCTLIHCDAMDDVNDYLKRHPEKKMLFVFSKTAVFIARIDRFINP